MDKKTLLQRLAECEEVLESVQDATAHTGIALELMAYVQEYNAHNQREIELHDDPFYYFFQNAAHDIHTAFPLRKMAMQSAIAGYRRYLGGEQTVH